MENPQRPDVQPHRERIEAQWVTGFVDGEGSFHIAFQKRPDLKFNWQAVPEFHVSQNFTGRAVLEEVKENDIHRRFENECLWPTYGC